MESLSEQLPTSFKADWGLDPEVAYLNHGSFGACPIPVLAELQRLQVELEYQPGTFLNRESASRLAVARGALGGFLNCDPDDLAFVPNVTMAINSVLRSLPLREGDELIVSSHEYNATRNVLDYVAAASGSRVVVVDIPFPIAGPEVVVDAMRGAITKRTRLALLDHVTSATGMVMPLAQLIALFHEQGVAVFVDGAHAPGMIPVDLEALAPDYYAGNCHKWICSPKGAGFLYVRRELQHEVRPAVISHGANAGLEGNARFRAEFEWMGTRDITPWLCVPTALRYMEGLLPGGWPEVMARNHDLVVEGRRRIAQALGIEPPCPETMLGSLATLHVPATHKFGPATATSALGLDVLQEALYDGYRIEVPVLTCPASGRRMFRISAQLYNEIEEYDRLAKALAELL
ncbi:MAG: isopenicillin-N epimerase [Myxococcota bacterium]